MLTFMAVEIPHYFESPETITVRSNDYLLSSMNHNQSHSSSFRNNYSKLLFASWILSYWTQLFWVLQTSVQY